MVFMGLPGRRKLRQIAVQHCHEAAPVFEDILGPVVDVKAQVKRLKGRFTDAAAAAGHAVTQAASANSVLSSQQIPFSCSTHLVILASTNMAAATAVKTRQGIVTGFGLLQFVGQIRRYQPGIERIPRQDGIDGPLVI